MKTKVGVVQMTSTGDVEANLRTVERLVGEAAADGAKLVVIPECFAYLGPENGKLEIAEELPSPEGSAPLSTPGRAATPGGPILARMGELAKRSGAQLVLGGFWEKGASAGKVRNACVHVDEHGAVRAVYRKIHLFDVDLPDGTKLEESATVEPGSELVVADAPFGKLGLSVCYDVRFPELYRGLVDRGAIALAVPAAFTLTTGKDHWHVLLRARAIEAQSYVLAAAQTGHHFGQRRSYGHALICDPWGTILAECGEGEGFATAWIDTTVVEKVRGSLPSLRHRVIGATR
ncbi:carbon-nitrogen hydrolase family protein [Sandaracinus amylolyticus]|nr:carbon-nitrogen hydrolase family protein [Sandaracinus amylolyticus]